MDKRTNCPTTMSSSRHLCFFSSYVPSALASRRRRLLSTLASRRRRLLSTSPIQSRSLSLSASQSPLIMDAPPSQASPRDEPVAAPTSGSSRWRPTCLYFTQGRCTMMDDPIHLERFNHDLSVGLQVAGAIVRSGSSQSLNYLLVLDLEGKVEILEFPVILMDAKTREYVDFFHRFVRPVGMSEQRINEYIQGKYGKMGVDRVWHDTAIPFKQVIEQFEEWITKHGLWKNGVGSSLHQAAFVTCGNWDIKTKVPQQCRVSQMKLPQYFTEWINLKDVYVNYYQRKAMGMRSMMNQLRIPLTGSHHLGIDDSKNIAKVLQQMLADGALMQITARRSSQIPEKVEFLFKNRV